MKKQYFRHEAPVIMHKGVFHKKPTVLSTVALIIGGTLGAGILGLPYAISQVGITLGIIMITLIGLLMIGLNLLIAEVAVNTKDGHQLVGLAGEYIGKGGKFLMGILMYLSFFGVMVVYILGVGEIGYAFFGGEPAWYSALFFILGLIIVYYGVKMLRIAELFITLGILFVVLFITLVSMPHIDIVHYTGFEITKFLIPYGVILFACNGTTIIPEAYSMMKDQKENFRKSIIWGGIITIFIYILFSFIVVGVTGLQTTEIATLGLGKKIGAVVFLLGNLFAFLAMTTGFLTTGVVIKDSFMWDLKMKKIQATFLVGFFPLVILFLGLRSFTQGLELVGGVFMSLQVCLLLLIYYRAKHKGHIKVARFVPKHSYLLLSALMFAITLGMLHSVLGLF